MTHEVCFYSSLETGNSQRWQRSNSNDKHLLIKMYSAKICFHASSSAKNENIFFASFLLNCCVKRLNMYK